MTLAERERAERGGARHLVLAPVPPYPGPRWLADEIIEPVKAEAGLA